MTGSSGAESASRAEACIAYLTAACKRGAECGGYDPGDCFAFTRACPDATFAPGSTATVAGLLACADAYATFSCTAINHYQAPSCAPTGTLEGGEHCDFSVQCASQTCVGAPCGACAKSVGVGEPCTFEGVVCAAGLYCGPNAKCVAAPDPGAPPEQVGEACTGNVDCPTASYCSLPPAANAGTCTQYPDAGEACTEEPCRDGNYCGPDETCHALPGDGAACGVDALTGRASWCVTGLFCSPGATPAEGTCRTPQSEGQPCLTSAGAPVLTSCASGLRCDASAMPPLCLGAGGVGEGCSELPGGATCKSGSECECADDACSTSVCKRIGYAGDRCDDGSLTICHPAFACADGVCVPREPETETDDCTP